MSAAPAAEPRRRVVYVRRWSDLIRVGGGAALGYAAAALVHLALGVPTEAEAEPRPAPRSQPQPEPG